MTIEEKLTTIAENEKRLYNGWHEEVQRKFWEIFTNNGKREYYIRAFHDVKNFDDFSFPKDLVKPKYTYRLFNSSPSLTKLPEGLDLSHMLTDLADGTYGGQEFGYTGIKHFTDINMPALDSYWWTFIDCFDLHTIDVLRVHKDTRFSAVFTRCKKLQNITIEGEIGKNGFNVTDCPLNHASLMSIINALYDYSEDTSGTSHTVSLGSANIEKLSEEEQQIAIDKGWTII